MQHCLSNRGRTFYGLYKKKIMHNFACPLPFFSDIFANSNSSSINSDLHRFLETLEKDVQIVCIDD